MLFQRVQQAHGQAVVGQDYRYYGYHTEDDFDDGGEGDDEDDGDDEVDQRGGWGRGVAQTLSMPLTLYTPYMYSPRPTCTLHTLHVLSTPYMYSPRPTCTLHTLHVLSTPYMYSPHPTCTLHTLHVLSTPYMYSTHPTRTLNTLHVHTCVDPCFRGREMLYPPPRSGSIGTSIPVDAQTDSNHDTALTLAAQGGYDKLVQLLLSHSADIEHKDKKGNE